MKSVMMSILLFAFLQMVWLSISTCQQTDSAVSCPKFDGNSTSCCGAENSSCVFFRCAGDSDEGGKCIDVANATTPTCEATQKPATFYCNGSSADNCAQYKQDEATCCGDVTCGFFFCSNGTDPKAAEMKFCARKNENDSACDSGEQLSNNTCAAPPTTSTSAPPTSSPKPDECAAYNDNKTNCCGAASTHNCTFYKCTYKDSTTHTACSSKNITYVCSENATSMTVSCDDTPAVPTTTTTATTSQAPTKAPSGGGSGGGRHFDPASFIGGIVLCAGLVAIGYFGLKFYKSRQERNYHTL